MNDIGSSARRTLGQTHINGTGSNACRIEVYCADKKNNNKEQIGHNFVL